MSNQPKSNDSAQMNQRERRDLAGLARKRARVLKSMAAERKAELLADFETELASIYTPDDDAAMKKIFDEANKQVNAAKARLRSRCDKLGIPREFAPGIDLGWYGRGENALNSRRVELRKVATTRLDAAEKRARVEIERACIDTETKLIAGGLTSDAAQRFLEQMPSVEDLMPRLDAAEIKGLFPDRDEEEEES